MNCTAYLHVIETIQFVNRTVTSVCLTTPAQSIFLKSVFKSFVPLGPPRLVAQGRPYLFEEVQISNREPTAF